MVRTFLIVPKIQTLLRAKPLTNVRMKVHATEFALRVWQLDVMNNRVVYAKATHRLELSIASRTPGHATYKKSENINIISDMSVNHK